MTSILSTISGQFGKSWILGALLPVALATVLALVFVQPLLPDGWQVMGTLDELDTRNLVALSLWAILASGLLYHLNIPLLRFYEGYPWEDGWIGRKRKAHYQSRFRALSARWTGMRSLFRAWPQNDPRTDDRDHVREEWKRLGLRRVNELPGEESLVLPTRLGNVIRSFEEYPRVQYGIDSIALWPHLMAVIAQDEAAAIDNEKVSFDFMLNCSFLLSVLGYATVAAGLLHYLPLDPWWAVPWSWLAGVAALIGLAWLFYLGAIHRAEGWGSTVRASFEVNRWTLLARLGYDVGPISLHSERELWLSVSQQILYRDDPTGPASSYRVRTYAQGQPRNISLDVTRSITPPRQGTESGVVIVVRNVDRRHAAHVTVTDSVPDGFAYRTDSAVAGVLPVRVVGTNPYRFTLGDLRPGETVRLTYRLVPHG